MQKTKGNTETRKYAKKMSIEKAEEREKKEIER